MVVMVVKIGDDREAVKSVVVVVVVYLYFQRWWR